jgi:hypothetical protein
MTATVRIGTKRQVYNGTAKQTSGGLRKEDLMMYKGRIVSRKQHSAGLKAIERLKKLGYVAKKGRFSLFRKKSSKKSKKTGGADGDDMVDGMLEESNHVIENDADSVQEESNHVTETNNVTGGRRGRKARKTRKTRRH